MAEERKNWVYWVCATSCYLWGRVWLRMSVKGVKNIPATGGCVLAMNHASYLDPPLAGAAVFHRVVHIMARDSLFRTRFSSWLLHRLAAVPLDRDRGDVAALKRGLALLKNGGVLGIFPEGTRSHDGELAEPKSGIGFMVAKAGVPVVPCYIDGTFRAFPRGARFVKPAKVRLIYGEPIQPEEIAALGKGREAYQRAGELVMARIAALRPE